MGAAEVREGLAAATKLGHAESVTEPKTTGAVRPQAQPAARLGGLPKLGAIPAVKPAPAPVKPLAPPPGVAISPRPPAAAMNAAASADVREPSPSAPAVTETIATMPQIAVEAALAELTAWRREAERKISRLENEIAQLRSAAARSPLPPAVSPLPDRSRDPTAAILPEFQSLRDSPAVWATPAAALAPIAAPALAPVLAEAPPRALSVAPRLEPRQHFDLEMKPGEYFDLPSELRGGRQKRVAWFLAVLILFVVGTLVVSSMVSNR
jgi:hypothetical protein